MDSFIGCRDDLPGHRVQQDSGTFRRENSEANDRVHWKSLDVGSEDLFRFVC